MNIRKQNEKEWTFLSGYKARITLSHLIGSHNFQPRDESISFFEINSYSGYCRVRSDGGSLIELGGKIPDVSYVVAKLTTLCLGRSLQIR